MWIFQFSMDEPRVWSRGPASSRSTRFELRSIKSWDNMNKQKETESKRPPYYCCTIMIGLYLCYIIRTGWCNRFEPSLATLSCIVGTRAHTVAVIHFIGIVSFVQLERRSGGQGDNPGSATSIDTFLKTKSLLQTRIVTASALLVERPNSPAWQIDITQPFSNTF